MLGIGGMCNAYSSTPDVQMRERVKPHIALIIILSRRCLDIFNIKYRMKVDNQVIQIIHQVKVKDIFGIYK